MDILDQYVKKTPDKQAILDVFADEWSSAMPSGSQLTTSPGSVPLFEDSRIEWARQTMGGFNDLNILELGPLEGGHSYMLEQLGSKSIVAIEANTRAFLKCLCIKQVFDLKKVEFKLGDFMSYLEDTRQQYDVVIASGVLYHMLEPMRLIELIAKTAPRVFFWTHYYDSEIIGNNPNLAHRFNDPVDAEHAGFKYQMATLSYKDALDWAGFCGGSQPTTHWLTRESILSALKHYGYNQIEINFDTPDHSNGPSFAVCATR
ncbi:MAG: class I SAM-dependent methyltransferase [Methylococcales bacterium]